MGVLSAFFYRLVGRLREALQTKKIAAADAVLGSRAAHAPESKNP
jgi:hypothetical protein